MNENLDGAICALLVVVVIFAAYAGFFAIEALAR